VREFQFLGNMQKGCRKAARKIGAGIFAVKPQRERKKYLGSVGVGRSSFLYRAKEGVLFILHL